jgi:hypothetical protein
MRRVSRCCVFIPSAHADGTDSIVHQVSTICVSKWNQEASLRLRIIPSAHADGTDFSHPH